jgi:hypothetical protein
MAMIKRMIVGLTLLLALALAGSACDESSSGAGLSMTGATASSNHRWDLILTNLDPNASTCPTGLFEGLPDLLAALPLPLPDMLSDMPFSLAPSLEVLTSAYTQEANVPEIYLLSFSTWPTMIVPSPVAAGDQIQVQYTRRIVSDGKDGDFFAARLTNQRSYEFIEDLTHREMKNSDTKTITYTATAQGDFLGLDLIVGLSGPADYLILDDLTITVNSVPLLTENFEGDTLTPSVPPGRYLWLEVVPAQALGHAGITGDPGEVLAGNQSYQFQGGRLFHLYGQSFSQAGVEAAEFNLTDGAVDSTYWQGLFMGMSQDSALVGNYNGHNYDLSCRENGMFFILEDSDGNADAGGNWAITLTAELLHCAPGLGYSDTLFPETAYAVTIVQFQTALGGVLMGNTIVDSKGNEVGFSGLVLGDMVLLLAGVSTPAVPGGMIYNAAFLGALTETDTGATVAGTVMGLAFPPPDTCELSGTFTAAITRP